MSEFLSKLSSYNLFNNLVPGVLFLGIANRIIGRDLVPHDLVFSFFAYYFAGMVIGRFGSLVMEPVLKRTKFLRYGDYGNFVRSSRVDPKIETLLEVSNMYRSMTATLLLLLLVKPFLWLVGGTPFVRRYWIELLCAVLFFVFALSFRKQNGYVNRRVAANTEHHNAAPETEK